MAAASLLSCAPDLSTWAPALARYSGGLFDWQLVDLELGRIAAVSGDWAGAGEHFESAKRVCDAGGLRAFEGQVAFHHGVMLLRSGDRRRGVAMVEEAYASLSQLGLEYLAGKASAVLSRPSRGRPLTAGPGGLTEREYGVLRLVSEGYSVREIAEELVISERTVGNHLAKVYEKLGMRRSQAIAWFVHNRLEASEGEHEE